VVTVPPFVEVGDSETEDARGAVIMTTTVLDEPFKVAETVTGVSTVTGALVIANIAEFEPGRMVTDGGVE
jgi:hypothetical protein